MTDVVIRHNQDENPVPHECQRLLIQYRAYRNSTAAICVAAIAAPALAPACALMAAATLLIQIRLEDLNCPGS